ncbi:hypothetical protein [Nakamurella multipartita]|uniref:hypothetical protein n=1 Tax=Nakamurella multipartita TaxID=53461 RepID=UPI00019E91D7|nr:hypothetical protein [Nakamurella multipartita]
MVRSSGRGAQVLLKWFNEGGSTAAFDDFVNLVLQQDDSIVPLVSGLVNVGAVSTSMLGILLNSSPELVIKNFAMPDIDVADAAIPE